MAVYESDPMAVQVSSRYPESFIDKTPMLDDNIQTIVFKDLLDKTF